MKGILVAHGFYSCDFAGIKLTRYNQQGRIDKEKLIKEKLPNLDEAAMEQYRKPGGERWRVNRTKSVVPKNVKSQEVKESLKNAEISVTT